MINWGDNKKKIIKLRFGLGKTAPQTLDDIGKSFGVTRERVRQIEVKSRELKKIISTSGDVDDL